MAKQTGPTFITGTYQGLCFYEWGGGYFVRRVSSLTAEKVKQDSAFVNTRKSASQLAKAAVLASQVYRTLRKENKSLTLYRKMTGIAKLMLKEGKNEEQVLEALSKQQHVPTPALKNAVVRNKEEKSTIITMPDQIEPAYHRADDSRYFKISARSIRELNPRPDPIIKSLAELLPFRGQRKMYMFKC